MAVAAPPIEAQRGGRWLAFGAVLVVGTALDAICRYYPAHLPAWMPWEFSWPVYLATVLTLGWFGQGLARLPRAEHPPIWRSVCFVVGVVSIYVMLQTRVDYYAQHLFFVHRAQHFMLHHLSAFLIALGCAGPVLWAGIPEFLKPAVASKPVQRTIDFIQHPIVAPVLFVGMIYLWVIPALHTRVMLDINLYNLMNWSMALDGICFWCLIL
ncbi:MAG TPA: cytochrome c oxidase assembly protein, partial [Rhizomicrobium sp.]|nr:cytochrome c oxidase assembly protein [Rhizomicrobium sp.]